MNLYECLHMYIFIYTCMIIILKFKKKILDYCLLLIRFFPNNMTTIAISAWLPTIPSPNFYWKNSHKTETNCVCCSVKQGT